MWIMWIIQATDNPDWATFNPHFSPRESLKIRAISILFSIGFDSGVIFVILRNFLMLILCDQLFILITTVHRCFLFKKNLPGYWPFCPCFAFSSFHLLVLQLLWYARVIRTLNIFAQKRITPYRKGRIHGEIFLLEYFMKYSFRGISLNLKYFHEILLPQYLNFIAYVCHQ